MERQQIRIASHYDAGPDMRGNLAKVHFAKKRQNEPLLNANTASAMPLAPK